MSYIDITLPEGKFFNIVERIARETRAEVRMDEKCAEDMGGHCVIASTELMDNLQAAGIDCSVEINNCHGFNLVRNRIVDITATQFGHSDIFMIPLSDRKMYGFYTEGTVFNNRKDVVEHQKRVGWPTHQQAKLK